MLKNLLKWILPYGMVRFLQRKKPVYAVSPVLADWRPDIFNAQGERMEIFYIQDKQFAHCPQQSSQRIYWDRYNYGIDVHFYTNTHMFQTRGTPTRKYGWLLESESLAAREYEKILSHPETVAEFHNIFTFSERLLDAFPNALFAPASCLWYGHRLLGGGTLRADAWQRKTKNISIVSSASHAPGNSPLP